MDSGTNPEPTHVASSASEAVSGHATLYWVGDAAGVLDTVPGAEKPAVCCHLGFSPVASSLVRFSLCCTFARVTLSHNRLLYVCGHIHSTSKAPITKLFFVFLVYYFAFFWLVFFVIGFFVGLAVFLCCFYFWLVRYSICSFFVKLLTNLR